MIDFVKSKIHIIGLGLVSLVGIYFLYMWQTKKIIHNELKKIAKEKKKRVVKDMKRQQMSQHRQQIYDPREGHDPRVQEHYRHQEHQDIDSYIDPDMNGGEGEQMEVMNDSIESSHGSRRNPRLTSDTVLMRDMTDGSH